MAFRRKAQASQLATALIEHSSDAITLVDESGTVLYANPATANMLGLQIAEAVNANVFQWVHEDDVRAFRAKFASPPEKRVAPVRHALRLRHSDHTWRHIESVMVNRLHDPGIRGIIINCRDVTDALRAEQALRQGEARYRQLTEQTTDIIYNCDFQGRFTFVNPTAVRLMKFTEQELLGRHYLTLIRKDYRDRAEAFYARQRQEFIRSSYFEFPAIAKDGTELWLGQSVQIVEEHGTPVGVQAIARDITSRLALEEQLRQAQKMDAIGRLAGGVAHDFNNLLTAILGSAELLATMLEPDDPKFTEADAIRRAAERGAGLTKRLLAFSRPQSPAPAVGDLVDIVTNMQPVLRRLVLDKITIQVSSALPAISVRADETALSQIVLNLIVNARDAMPDGGTATIEASMVALEESRALTLGVAPGSYGRLCVSDTGHGIPADIQPHLFEPFFSTKRPDQGTGLGLSIVYGIAKGLGGAIEVESEVGCGATFKVYLPLATDGAAVLEANTTRNV